MSHECRTKAWITKHAGGKPAFNEPRLSSVMVSLMRLANQLARGCCWLRRRRRHRAHRTLCRSLPPRPVVASRHALVKQSVPVGQEPGLEEALRPQHWQSGVRRSWARHYSPRRGEYVYFGFDLKPVLPFAVPACVAAKLASVALLLLLHLQALGISVACN